MTRNKNLEKLNDNAAEFNRQQTISNGLSEIYQDDDGSIIDVKKLQIRGQRPWWWVSRAVIYGAVAAAVAAGGWWWWHGQADPLAVDLNLSGPANVVAGAEFTYTLAYHNQTAETLRNLNFKLEYPTNFVFVSAEPAPNAGTAQWQLDELAGGGQGAILIKGKIINQVGLSNVATAEMFYNLDKFSSEYKKVATLDTPVASTGLELAVTHDASALVGEQQIMRLRYRLKDDGQISHFWLSVEPADISQVEFVNTDEVTPGVNLIKPWVWEISQVDKTDRDLPINFKFIDKPADAYPLTIKLSVTPPIDLTAALSATSTPATTTTPLATASPEDVFYQETVNYEVVKNDLNLSLAANGSDQNQGVNFGQTINYSISYANKSREAIDDVMIMAVIQGDIVNWSSWSDKNHGQVSGDTITWTKDQLPELAHLKPGAIGWLDFSVKLKNWNDLKGGQFDRAITAYAQFTANQNAPIKPQTSDNKSNVIANSLNSDIIFDQKVFYFSDSNLPLGNGPLPFTVGQATVVRNSWQLISTLHDLHDVKISVTLPEYVKWAGKEQKNDGDLFYDEANRVISWNVNRLAVGQTDTAEFDLSVEPRESERRQLLVIFPKAKVTAIDSDTGNTLTKDGKIKTGRLEDDPLISSGDVDNNEGLVR